ncbi:hypothetical protein QBC38DRAFT_490549 [Podospora fimiseda]|uniref:Zn(2)-C6 fungal-type domain-containing protein n=1 Tax=Podospora fimiseda TaxID=252190 RepID=A0AAN6YMR8_9PEZI|nr:hypothetical protein QBC38DRAFT_490549 [Podospora fimiseda]
MAATPSYQTPQEQSPFPPMPRRQSCDRCHEQKVRCIAQGSDGIPGLGAIAEDESTLGKQVLAETPCMRCSKAGTICIFSPQLRSGRPRVHRAPASSSRQRRSRQGSSRCSSSSPSMSPGMSPAVSQSSSPRSLPLNFSTPASMDYSSMAPSVASSPAPIPHYNPQEQDLRVHETPDHWFLSSFGPEDPQYLESVGCQQPQYPHLADTSSFLMNNMYHPDTTPTAETVLPNTIWGQPNPSEAHHSPISLQELSQITLRIHQAIQALSQQPQHIHVHVLSLSSPTLTELFNASSTFIALINQYRPPHARRHQEILTPNQYPGRQLQAESSTLNPVAEAENISFLLTILACHQLILGGFEAICAGIVHHHPHHHQHQQEVLGVVNYMSHILSELNRSIASLGRTAWNERTNDYSIGTGVMSSVLWQAEDTRVRVCGRVQELRRVFGAR